MAVALLFPRPVSAGAEPVTNGDQRVKPARVVALHTLVDKPRIKVRLVVEDTGGSTDVSPTQKLHFTLYAKGEMFSTDASYDLGPMFAFRSAKRLDAGLYEIELDGVDPETAMPKAVRWKIDARRAIVKLKNVRCGDDFDCAASREFEAPVTVSRP